MDRASRVFKGYIRLYKVISGYIRFFKCYIAL